MLLLPSRPRRATLISFWLVISCLTGLLLGVISSLLLSWSWFASGVIPGGMLLILGLVWPNVLPIPYRAWNRFVRLYSRFAGLVVLSVYFYVTFVALGRVKARLVLERPQSGNSMWTARRTLTPEAYALQYDGTTTALGHGHGFRDYLSWAVNSGNLWLVFLLPFHLLVGLHLAEQKRLPDNHIYTLF